jgi:hypothetical protein
MNCKQLIDQIGQIVRIDVSRNIQKIKGTNQFRFISDEHFDWHTEGIFIYDPKLESDLGHRYICRGKSDVYENTLIYVRDNIDKLLPETYYVVDEEEEKDGSKQYLFTDFIIFFG